MHPPAVRAKVLELADQGLNDSEVSRLTGVPRRTVRDMRVQPYLPLTLRGPCPRCWDLGPAMTFTPAGYCELLGLYLGDGHISEHPRAQCLRITFDLKYPEILRESEALLKRCFCGNSTGRVLPRDSHCVVLWVYSRHLGCLFPQHGPGPKHSRSISLETWQESLVSQEPFALLKGLIRTDGCSFINRTGDYEYLSYQFFNTSEGIVELFCRTCDRVGIEHRVNKSRGRKGWSIRVNRRDSVAILQEEIGIKR